MKTVSSVVTLDVAHTYDSLGRMLTRKLSTDTNPTRLEWDGWDLVREVAPDGTETVYYAPLGEITSFKRGSSVYQVHADALGSVRRSTDSAGGTVVDLDFDAWGGLVASSGSMVDATASRFVGAFGARSDGDTGLTLMRRRWYDAALGRFISRDPRRIGLPDNLYVYASNNPTLLIDPSGKFVQIDYDRSTKTVTATEYEWNSSSKEWEVGETHTFTNVFSGDKSALGRTDNDYVVGIGPTPTGEYYVGPLTTVRPTHPELTGDVMWLPLLNTETMENVHPVRDPKGNVVVRSEFYIHPGRVSQGCMTFYSETAKDQNRGYPWSSDYDRLRNIISNTTPATVKTKWDESGYGSVPEKTHFVRGRVRVR